MDRGKLLLVVASLVVSVLVVEISFWLLAQAEPIYPLVSYRTDDPDRRLHCYDDHFVGMPDWDLRRAHPFGKLTYGSNFNEDPALATLSPLKVPNAIEIRRNEKGLRERPMAAFDAERDKIVVLVGDSFCFGQGVRVVDRFSNVLETRLNREHPAERYRLFNTCEPAANIEQIVDTMEYGVESFAQVDRVVYSFVLDDPIIKRKGRLDERKIELSRGIVEKNGYRLELEGEFNDFMHLRTRPNAESARFLAGRNSYTLRWFAVRLQRQQIARETIEYYRQLYTNNPRWPQTRQMLGRMKDYCSAKGIAFSLVVWPLFHLDLLPLFAGKDAQEYWVHPTDFHPNNRGHAEAAAFLYDAIPW